MRELVEVLDEWAGSHQVVGMATVVRTSGSTPRPVGARLAVTPDLRLSGSVSGGCLEADVVERLGPVMRGDEPPAVEGYGISDELGFTVGLSCGGTVDILLEAWRWDGSDPVLARLRAAVLDDLPVVLGTVVDGPAAGTRALVEGERATGSLGDPAADLALVAAAAARTRTGVPGIDELAGLRVFVEPHVPALRMVIVGATDIGAALCSLAQTLGYRVTVIDPRSAFLTTERFPTADELVHAWPDRALVDIGLGVRDAAVCLSHDPKFDEPTLAALLRSDTGYVGAIGSRRTHEKRVERLRAMGFDDLAIDRVHSPVGLDIGARSPGEIALAILAEAVAVRRGRAGGSLRRGLAVAAG